MPHRTPIGYYKTGGKTRPIHASTGKYRHQRLVAPSHFQKDSFRTVTQGSHRVVVGRLKGQQTTTAQAILHPKHEPPHGDGAGMVEHHSPALASQHIVNIAKGKAKPRTVKEAKAALMYMEAERKMRNAKELEAKKALLAFEKGTGTTARLKRAFKELPQSSARARIEVERKARRKIGLSLQRLRGFRF